MNTYYDKYPKCESKLYLISEDDASYYGVYLDCGYT